MLRLYEKGLGDRTSFRDVESIEIDVNKCSVYTNEHEPTSFFKKIQKHDPD